MPTTPETDTHAERVKEMRNARDGVATEHLEIAVYRLIEELAQKFVVLDFEEQEVA